jgi:uncharacterized membrane protein
MAGLDRAGLKAAAKESLAGNWGEAILVFLVYAVIAGAVSGFTFGLASLCVGPLSVGLAAYYLNLARRREKKIENVFEGFGSCFVNSLLASLVSTLLICLGSIVIVPGVILALGWSQYAYVLRDEPELDAWAALERSRRLMAGHKGELFVLCLSFLGWFVLVGISFGLASFYVMPYAQATMAAYHERLLECEAGAAA